MILAGSTRPAIDAIIPGMNRLHESTVDLGAASLRSLSDAERDRYGLITDMVREISRQTDPHLVTNVFRRCMQRLYGGEHSFSISRRELEPPYYRITRSTRWTEDINPWVEKRRLPLLKGGLLADLLYQGDPQMFTDFQAPPDEPAGEYLRDARSFLYLPIYDGGDALNAVVRTSSDPQGFQPSQFADALLAANLFGRATQLLLFARQLQAANAELEREMDRVSQIQRSLLPARLPDIPDLDLAVSYQTARRAGGDYYDFFNLRDGRWGVLIADVSGHGTPAAVVMAMLRMLMHSQCIECKSADDILGLANRQLCSEADRHDGTFVTAFYGIYNPVDRSLQYACAGHHPPLLVDRRIQVQELDEAQSLPLGVDGDTPFPTARATLAPGDTLLLYTDGITEATNAAGEMYGRRRLLSCVREDVPNARHIIDCVYHKLLAFTGDTARDDDQTLLAMRVR